jgi:hypothetical protein
MNILTTKTPAALAAAVATYSGPRSRVIDGSADALAALSLAVSARRLDASPSDAVEALVCLRTYLHNEIILPQALGETSDYDCEQWTAIAALANEIDAIDEVWIRLDSRVLNGVAEYVPYESIEVRNAHILSVAATLNARDAVRLALRATDDWLGTSAAADLGDTMRVQLELPFGDDGARRSVSAGETGRDGGQPTRLKRRRGGGVALLVGSASRCAAAYPGGRRPGAVSHSQNCTCRTRSRSVSAAASTRQ